MNYTATIRSNLPPQPELFQLFEEEAVPGHPVWVSEPRGAQVVVQRHYMEHIGGHLPFSADSRCSCAADGGPAGGRAYTSRFLGPRAGYCCAQALMAIPQWYSYGGWVLLVTILLALCSL